MLGSSSPRFVLPSCLMVLVILVMIVVEMKSGRLYGVVVIWPHTYNLLCSLFSGIDTCNTMTSISPHIGKGSVFI